MWFLKHISVPAEVLYVNRVVLKELCIFIIVSGLAVCIATKVGSFKAVATKEAICPWSIFTAVKGNYCKASCEMCFSETYRISEVKHMQIFLLGLSQCKHTRKSGKGRNIFFLFSHLLILYWGAWCCSSIFIPCVTFVAKELYKPLVVYFCDSHLRQYSRSSAVYRGYKTNQ